MQFKSALIVTSLASMVMGQSVSASVSTVSAASTLSVASGCSFQTATATSQADLDEYADCQALRGELHISGDLGNAALNNVQAVYGSIIINNATSLSAFSAGSLSTITGSLTLTSLTILSTLDLPLLTTVGAINFVTLPALTAINLNSGVTSIETLYISDTSLESLDGFDVSSLDTFNVNNNKNLNSIDANLKNVKTALEVSFNSDSVEVAFDELEWANNITFRDVASISLAKLQKVNASLGFINNSLTDIELSTLKEIGGSLSIVSNDELETINLDNVTSIGGGFVISNNSALENIDGFDSLQTVAGAVIFVGSFNNASLPSLKRVSGGVQIESDGELDCDSFNELNRKGAIQGDNFVCKGASTSVSVNIAASSTVVTGGSAVASATASSSASSSSNNAAGSVGFESGSIVAAIGAFMFALL